MTKRTMMGWWFAPADLRLRNNDGRKIKVGVTHEVTGDPVLCEHGLHASPSALEALRYANGAVLFRV